MLPQKGPWERAMLKRSEAGVLGMPLFLSPTPTLGVLQSHFACSLLVNTETEAESSLAPRSTLFWSPKTTPHFPTTPGHMQHGPESG